MTKQEFLETLRKVLGRELSVQEVEENIRYYDQYIAQETAAGKTEQQVLESLGDPRLIARTILQVDEERTAQSISFEERASVFTEEPDGAYRAQTGEEMEEEELFGSRIRHHSVSGWKAWLVLILILAAVFFVLGLVFRVLWALLPVFLIFAAASWIYRRFFR